nr:hypothetical protein Itr_chr12CG22890 [Ipomoea trifida]
MPALCSKAFGGGILIRIARIQVEDDIGNSSKHGVHHSPAFSMISLNNTALLLLLGVLRRRKLLSLNNFWVLRTQIHCESVTCVPRAVHTN